jgi:Predicted membrane protein
MSEVTAQTGLSDNAASGLAYLTIIPAIIFLLVAPYNQNSTVKFHSWQSIFLGIAWVAVWIVLGIVGAIPFLNLVDLILMPLVGLVFLIVWLIAMINAFQGKKFSLPFLGPLAEKQAGA